MHEQSERFRALLIDFAKSIGKEDAEVYVDDGFWKARQGGNGVAYAQKSVISFKPCATEENAFNYELQKPITEELYELFRPFGYLKSWKQESESDDPGSQDRRCVRHENGGGTCQMSAYKVSDVHGMSGM